MEPEGGTTTSYSDFDFQNFSSSFYIAVNFSEPLLLTHIITSGFSNGYVNNFTLQYSLEGAESLETFGYSDTVQVNSRENVPLKRDDILNSFQLVIIVMHKRYIWNCQGVRSFFKSLCYF